MKRLRAQGKYFYKVRVIPDSLGPHAILFVAPGGDKTTPSIFAHGPPSRELALLRLSWG
jgi:hypothetical protein